MVYYKKVGHVVALLACCTTFTDSGIGQQRAPAMPHRIYEAQPQEIAQSADGFSQQVNGVGDRVGAVPKYLIVETTRRWQPGQALSIAFNGGDDDLYAKIEAAASEWTRPGAANIRLNFKDNAGHYLHWTSMDKDYAADVRVGFVSGKNGGGYWSLVGKDSVDRSLIGGAPNQASMNFDSFDKELPADWAGTVRHEFGHALGFEHEHQSPVGGCDFRFDDDQGYEKSLDANGWYTNDRQGRRPGLYTYLGGKANYWPPLVVDFQLRNIPTTSAFLIGPFDKQSIMKYFFDAAMFISGDQSPCYSQPENETLSAQDIAGVQKAYPPNSAVADRIAKQNIQTLREIAAAPNISAKLKSGITQRLNSALSTTVTK